jgi:hypothetical protein
MTGEAGGGNVGRIEGDRTMKVSVKVIALCYVGINFGVLVFSVTTLLQGVSVERSLIIYLASAVWMNLMLWGMFKMRDRGRH